MEQKQQNSPDNNEPSKQKRETVSELVHRHLKDSKHVLTDEEIRNAEFDAVDAPTDQESDVAATNSTVRNDPDTAID